MRSIASHNVRYLLRRLDLGNQDQVGRLRHNLLKIGEPSGNWLMRTMRSAAAEVHRAQSVAHQQPSGVFLGMMHRVFQIENDGIRPMQPGVDEVFRLVAGQVESRAPQPVASGRRGQRKRVGQCRSVRCPVRRGAPPLPPAQR